MERFVFMEGNARDIKLYSGNSNPNLQVDRPYLGQNLDTSMSRDFSRWRSFCSYKDSLRNADISLFSPHAADKRKPDGTPE